MRAAEKQTHGSRAVEGAAAQTSTSLQHALGLHSALMWDGARHTPPDVSPRVALAHQLRAQINVPAGTSGRPCAGRPACSPTQRLASCTLRARRPSRRSPQPALQCSSPRAAFLSCKVSCLLSPYHYFVVGCSLMVAPHIGFVACVAAGPVPRHRPRRVGAPIKVFCRRFALGASGAVAPPRRRKGRSTRRFRGGSQPRKARSTRSRALGAASGQLGWRLGHQLRRGASFLCGVDARPTTHAPRALVRCVCVYDS